MEEIQGLTDLQLQEADEEKERILAQLRELEKKVGKAWKMRHISTCWQCSAHWQLGQLRRVRSVVTSGCIAGTVLNLTWVGPGCMSLNQEPKTRCHGRWKQEN